MKIIAVAAGLLIPFMNAIAANDTATDPAAPKNIEWLKFPLVTPWDSVRIAWPLEKTLPSGARKYAIQVYFVFPLEHAGTKAQMATATLTALCGGHGQSSWQNVDVDAVQARNADGRRVIKYREALDSKATDIIKADIGSTWMGENACRLDEALANYRLWRPLSPSAAVQPFLSMAKPLEQDERTRPETKRTRTPKPMTIEIGSGASFCQSGVGPVETLGDQYFKRRKIRMSKTEESYEVLPRTPMTVFGNVLRKGETRYRAKGKLISVANGWWVSASFEDIAWALRRRHKIADDSGKLNTNPEATEFIANPQKVLSFEIPFPLKAADKNLKGDAMITVEKPITSGEVIIGCYLQVRSP